jgi:dTDP-glucose pyrophosphorylase
VVLVIRHELEADFREFFGNKLDGKIEVEFAYQELDNIPKGSSYPPERKKPWGTAHAILVAAGNISEPFVAINADDFYGAEAYAAVAGYLMKNTDETAHCMVGYKLTTTLSEHGTVSRGVCDYDQDHFLTKIREVTNIEKRGNEIGFENGQQQWISVNPGINVSMNFWGFYPGIFDIYRSGFENFIRKEKDNLKAEYYIALPLTEMIENGKGKVKIIETDARWFGVTYKEDKASAVETIRKLVKAGIYPENLWK